jgi:protein-S-isoprenylcysteine O-methyltransferase Ste14
MIDAREKPNHIPWPPLLYGGLAIAGMLLQYATPLPWPLPALKAIGMAAFIVGLSTDIGTMLLFVRQKANILPHKAATRLITSGPFRYSRNPIYVGNTLMLAGAGLAFSSLWLLAAAVLAAIATHHLAILREEAHLAAKFGAEWDAYAARTPRWLLF